MRSRQGAQGVGLATHGEGRLLGGSHLLAHGEEHPLQLGHRGSGVCPRRPLLLSGSLQRAACARAWLSAWRPWPSCL